MEMMTIFAFIALFLFLVAKVPYNGGTLHRERGAVTVTYESPLSVQATTTGPTTAQIKAQINEVSATIVASADGDVAATVTHNMGQDAAQLALGRPWVILEPILTLALTALPMWTITTKTAVVITLTKLASTGSGSGTAQLRTIILRPPAGAFSKLGVPGAA